MKILTDTKILFEAALNAFSYFENGILVRRIIPRLPLPPLSELPSSFNHELLS